MAPDPVAAVRAERGRHGPAATREAAEQERTDIYYENGALYYENHRLDRGSQVYVENKETGRYAGTITAINNGEVACGPAAAPMRSLSCVLTVVAEDARRRLPLQVWVRRTDGSKTKLYIQQLRLGKYTIDHKV